MLEDHPALDDLLWKSIEDGAFVADDAAIVSANPALGFLAECDAQALVGRRLETLFDDIDEPRASDQLQPTSRPARPVGRGRSVAAAIADLVAATDAGDRVHLRTLLRGPSGTRRPVTLTMVSAGTGRQLGIVRTTRTASEGVLRAFPAHPTPSSGSDSASGPAPPTADAELLRLARAGRIAAGFAHDINNMLAPVLIFSERLAAGVSLSADERELLSTVQAAAERCGSLSRRLLDSCRPQPNEFAPTDLVGLIADFESLTRRSLPKAIELDVELPAEHLIVNGEGGQLEQALANLVLNAQDAMPDGGSLRVELSQQAGTGEGDPPGSDRPRRVAQIAVVDSGHGIDPAARDRVFDPFFTTKGGRGTGLGLANVRDIIAAHGGTVELSSNVGTGTTVRVQLPLLDS